MTLLRTNVGDESAPMNDTKAAHHSALDRDEATVYRMIDSPVGRLWLAAASAGLRGISFAEELRDEPCDGRGEAPSTSEDDACRHLDEAERQIADYFEGRRRAFSVELDLRGVAGFRRAVLERLMTVGHGTTMSYGELAAAAGSPRAVRAAGSACANNPIPIVIPCHRVIRSDGSLGGYLGGLEAKRALLRLESYLPE